MAVEGDLVLEDGTGKNDANTYALVATGDTYHSLFDNDAWNEATDDEKATALVHGTAYADLRWTFIGDTTSPTDTDGAGQALEWPRDDGSGGALYDVEGNLIGDDEVPVQIINATLEYALAYLASGLLLKTPTIPDDAGRFVALKREKLGPLEEETRFSDARAARTLANYAQADRIMRQSGLVVVASNRAIRA